MNKFYFTYGLEDAEHPYIGGWTTVIASDAEHAVAAFRLYHPDKSPNTLNCAGVYSEDTFRASGMYTKGNFGKFELELIELNRLRFE